jgi:hypothetical protein
VPIADLVQAVSGRDRSQEDKTVSMTLADFLTAAYKLANDKARELGRIN